MSMNPLVFPTEQLLGPFIHQSRSSLEHFNRLVRSFCQISFSIVSTILDPVVTTEPRAASGFGVVNVEERWLRAEDGRIWVVR
jgi:hypothetical protein